MRLRLSSLLLAAITACGPAPPPPPRAEIARPAPIIAAPLAPPEEAPATATLPLFRRFPALAERLAHVPLGVFPTPVEHATELGRHLGINRLYIKRDDLSGEIYGGNKVRKLEFDLGEAQRLGRTTVVTSGSVGSNQALATALHARRLGMKTIALLLPEPPSDRVRRMLLAVQKAGAEIRYPRSPKHAEVVIDELDRKGEPEPYVIPPGGSGVLGNIGFVNAAFELKEQIAAGQLPEPDVIYLPLGTMGTAAGLGLGLEAAELKTKVIAVRAASPSTANEAGLRALFDATNDHLRALDPSFPKLRFSADRLRIEHGQVGAGYARPTPKAEAAARLFEDFTRIPLETTYTGKAFAALIDARAELGDQVVLFWDTFNSRPLDVDGVTPRDLPAALRGYFPP